MTFRSHYKAAFWVIIQYCTDFDWDNDRWHNGEFGLWQMEITQVYSTRRSVRYSKRGRGLPLLPGSENVDLLLPAPKKKTRTLYSAGDHHCVCCIDACSDFSTLLMCLNDFRPAGAFRGNVPGRSLPWRWQEETHRCVGRCHPPKDYGKNCPAALLIFWEILIKMFPSRLSATWEGGINE